MMQLAPEVKSLLDRLYNLRGKDSVILTKMNAEREEALKTKERTKQEKEKLKKEITQLTQEGETLSNQGNKLLEVLNNINKNDYGMVLDRLNINFNPQELSFKIKDLLPQTLKKIRIDKDSSNQKLDNIEVEMNNAITKVSELELRKDEVLSNQSKLNNFFEMILNGNINITRDEITSLLGKFAFNENEQREAAKILMFPEDALYEYDSFIKNGNHKVEATLKSRSISDVLVEAKQNSKVIPKENNELKEIKASAKENEELTNIFNNLVEKNIKPEVISEKYIKPEAISEKDKLDNLLLELGLNKDEFTAGAYAKLLDNYDETILKNNVLALKENNFDLDIVRENSELLYDKELKDKVLRLLDIGKEPQDISLVPTVLMKYNLMGLNNIINVLQISGLDPKKVPLMAY